MKTRSYRQNVYLEWAGEQLGTDCFIKTVDSFENMQHYVQELGRFDLEILEAARIILSHEGLSDMLDTVCDIATKENRYLIEVVVEQVKLVRKLREAP